MKHPIELKEKAISLRKSGYSLKEISEKLKIAKSTASLWSSNVKINKKGKKRLKKRKLLRYYKIKILWKKKKKKRLKKYNSWANKILKSVIIDKQLSRIMCALLYWAEGGKFTDIRLEFTNSDPIMIKTYLTLLKKGFNIDEKKLRANIHLHDYHDDITQKQFWSNVANIPISQFNKSWRKQNTKKRIRKNYPGCVRICYHSADTARRIKALYKNFINYI